MSLRLLKGEHIGLVGANDKGKSTFMNIIMGKLMPDEGKIEWSKNVRVGYFDQHMALEKGITVRDVLKSAFDFLYELESRMNEICDKMDVIEPATEKPKPVFQFKEARTSGRYLFISKALAVGYDEALSKPLDLSMEVGQKVVLTGANGIGKTTPLKSILGLIQPLSGSVELGNYLETGYFEQETDQSVATTYIEEIWNEFPSYMQYKVQVCDEAY